MTGRLKPGFFDLMNLCTWWFPVLVDTNLENLRKVHDCFGIKEAGIENCAKAVEYD